MPITCVHCKLTITYDGKFWRDWSEDPGDGFGGDVACHARPARDGRMQSHEPGRTTALNAFPIAEYVTTQDGTIHLANPHPDEETLCGIGITSEFEQGNETAIGTYATCGDCRRAFAEWKAAR
jgi:hypothetical protein